VQHCLDTGCQLGDLALPELRRFNSTFDQDFYSCLTLESVLRDHDVSGGTAPTRVRQAIEAARRRLVAARGFAHAHA
jgi:argininosuccinate lyase